MFEKHFHYDLLWWSKLNCKDSIYTTLCWFWCIAFTCLSAGVFSNRGMTPAQWDWSLAPWLKTYVRTWFPDPPPSAAVAIYMRRRQIDRKPRWKTRDGPWKRVKILATAQFTNTRGSGVQYINNETDMKSISNETDSNEFNPKSGAKMECAGIL